MIFSTGLPIAIWNAQHVFRKVCHGDRLHGMNFNMFTICITPLTLTRNGVPLNCHINLTKWLYCIYAAMRRKHVTVIYDVT